MNIEFVKKIKIRGENITYVRLMLSGRNYIDNLLSFILVDDPRNKFGISNLYICFCNRDDNSIFLDIDTENEKLNESIRNEIIDRPHCFKNVINMLILNSDINGDIFYSDMNIKEIGNDMYIYSCIRGYDANSNMFGKFHIELGITEKLEYNE